MVAFFATSRSAPTNQDDSQGRSRYPYLSGKLYPNGEFSVGIVPQKSESEYEKLYDKLYCDQFEVVQIPVHDYRGFRIEQQVYHNPTKKSVQIGLSSLINSHKGGKRKDGKPRNPRGLTGLTSHGKRSIRQACFLAQERLGKDRIGFATFTLPEMRRDLLSILIQDWPEIVRQFNQEIDREYERLGVSYPFRLGVTEIQEKRFLRDGLPVPHLHMVYHSHRGNYQWFFTAGKLREIWGRVVVCRLRYYLPDEELPEISFSASIDCQAIKKEPSRELAKYLSKGSVIKKMVDRGFVADVPKSWYHLPLFFRREIKRLTQPLPDWLKALAMSGADLCDRGLTEYLFPVSRQVAANPVQRVEKIDDRGRAYSVTQPTPDEKIVMVDQVFGYAGKLTEKYRKIYGIKKV